MIHCRKRRKWDGISEPDNFYEVFSKEFRKRILDANLLPSPEDKILEHRELDAMAWEITSSQEYHPANRNLMI
ncbi:hypothetical protein CEXT_209071 [Caerostris extrusa]|uniref:Uncharacterized protein n=1 Tax=Caerostris extrusa TaxID=172846 RepID=A0AAV4MLI1_CAEEX|nr:hypothetical protein CEXT_209071 [Caerostris extrusa]